MRKKILGKYKIKVFILFLCLFSTHANATLTASTDAFGRVTLTTNHAGSSFAFSKSADGNTYISLATSGTPSCVDKRPQFHWTRQNSPGSPKTFTGDRVGIVGAFAVAANMVLDGVTYPALVQSSWEHDARTWVYVDIMQGKAGLTNGSHTVSYSNGITQILYSNFTVPYGSPIYYKVVIDGTTTETLIITPVPNRKAAAQSFVDRMIAGGLFTSANLAADMSQYAVTIGSIAGAYYMTGDSRLISLAAAARTDYRSHQLNTSVPLVNYVQAPLSFYFAYKVFGNSQYMTDTDEYMANILSGYARSTQNGLAECWNITTPNQAMQGAFLAALLYSEPSSTYYHSSLLATIAQNNAENQFLNGSINPTTGAMPYAPLTPPTTNDMGYATFEWPAMKYISDKWGWRVTEVNLARDWMVAQFPYEEPYIYRSMFYGYQSPTNVQIRQLAKYYKDGSIPRDAVDMLYSAAFNTLSDESGFGYDTEYVPEGTDASTAPFTVPVSANNEWIFSNVQNMVFLGVPDRVWLAEVSTVFGLKFGTNAASSLKLGGSAASSLKN